MDFAQIAANVVSQAIGEPMIKSKLKDRDFTVIARDVVSRAIGENLTDGSPLPVKHFKTASQLRGRLGGLKGGKARAEKLSAKQRKTIALKAAKARWKK
jgi:hypothetical protein